MLSALPVLVILGLGALGCGSSNMSAGPASHTDVSLHQSTVDVDPDKPGSYDNDDREVSFGREASAGEKRAVIALLARYQRAAAASDGATACSLLYSPVAESVPQDYGEPPGPPSLRGKTCAVVMSKLFKQRHKQLVAGLATFHVSGVRVERNQGIALLGWGTSAEPEPYMRVHRERSAWKIGEFFPLVMQ